MLSDRKATVGYAVDLLRAHQLRRENAYLHGQMQVYHDELTLTRTEVKELKIIVQEYQDDSEKSQSLYKEYEARSKEHADEIRCLQQDFEMFKAEASQHQIQVKRKFADTAAEQRLLENELSRRENLCQHAADASRSELETFNARLDGLESVIGNKADAALVERLHRLIGSVQPPHASLDTVSRVVNSAEGIQVHDSQRTCPPEMSIRPPSNVHRDAATKFADQSSIPSDLDLDENVNTVSYAGHRIYDIEESDSLSFLSEPRAQAAELTRVNNLMQEKFEDWAHYYSRTLSLVRALPATFEDMVVRRFVEGIFQAVQRKQCKQWLELKGWTWENVTSFSSVSSQIPQSRNSNVDPSIEISARYSEKMGLLLGRRESAAKRTSNTLVPDGTRNDEKPATMPLRRSQRLIEKSNQKAMEAAERAIEPKSQVREGRSRKSIPNSNSQNCTGQKNNVLGQRQRKHILEKALQISGDKEIQYLEATVGQSPAGRPNSGLEDAEGEVESPHRSGKQVPAVGSSKKSRDRVICVPRLIPQKRALTEAARESSGDEGYLYEQPLMRNDVREMSVTKHRRVERRLPLPPPPEIPILSTSSDG